MNVTEIENYNHYRVHLRDRSIASIEINGQKVKTFIQCDNKQGPKLYVIKYASEIAYVGQTTDRLRTRLRNGLKAKGKHQYGYRWRDLPEVDILVWCFPNKDNKNKDNKINKYIETIEGELVFLFRRRTRKWPECQMEIHFHNEDSENKGAVKRAKIIFKEAMRDSRIDLKNQRIE